MNNNVKIEVSYPFGLYNSFKKLPKNNVFPCSALFNDELIGGLLLTCTTTDLMFFNIIPSSLPHPYLKFRMLNFKQIIYLIEIHLIFDSDKILKLHLNPIHVNVKMLFDLLIDKKFISFHFYNKETDLIASTYSNLDDEQIDWLIRNGNLISDLEHNINYTKLKHSLANKNNNMARFYMYNDSMSIEQSFIGINQKIVKLLN